MVLVAMFLGAFVPAAACDDIVTVARLRPNATAFTHSSGIDKAGQFVLRNAGDWAAIWQRIHSRMSPVPRLPEIDFAHDMMIVVALGRRRSGGHAIRIDQAWREGETTVVVVRQESRAAGCIVPSAMTSPVDVARLPAAQDPVEFRFESVILDCN